MKRVTPLTLSILISAVMTIGSPLVCPPSIASSNQLDPACPGIGLTPISTPGSTWTVAFNDDGLPPIGDGDTNDFILRIVFSATGELASFTRLPDSASAFRVLFFDGLPVLSNFTPVGSSVFVTVVPNTPLTTLNLWSSVGGGRVVYAGSTEQWAICETNCQVTPEPTPLALISGALGLLVIGRVLRSRR